MYYQDQQQTDLTNQNQLRITGTEEWRVSPRQDKRTLVVWRYLPMPSSATEQLKRSFRSRAIAEKTAAQLNALVRESFNAAYKEGD